MVRQSPMMILLAEQARHSLPTFSKMAVNTARFISTRVFPRSNTMRKVHHGIRNWYEGGWPIWTGGNFPYVPSLIQDARWDQNYVTRREMMRRMRYESQNFALVESILSVGERYTVGAAGLHVSFYPNDGDISVDSDDWYDRANAVVQEWFSDCGWNNEPMEQLLKVGYRCQRVDGEIFYLKTRKKGVVDYDGRKVPIWKPCLQMVEAHRVETPWLRFDDDTLIDGIQFKLEQVGQGQEKRPMIDKVGCWVRNGFGGFEQDDSWSLIPYENLFQVFNSHRANQYRGLSDFYACALDIIKLQSLVEIELKAQATQSVRAVAIESNSGQINPLDPKLVAINRARGVTTQPNNAEKELFARYETYRKETGAYVFGIKSGEKVQHMAPNRPSEATLNLWEYLVNSICAGTHAARCLVFEKISGQSARSQGVEVRAQLDSADAFHKGDHQKWKRFTTDAVIWFMEWAIQHDSRVSDAPPDWKSCLHVQQPEACNVDVGYTTTANMMSLAAGAMDYEMILGPQGLSFVTVIKRLSRQQKLIERLKVKVTLPALLPGQIPLDGKPAQEKEKETA